MSARRLFAIMVKELRQMRRDRITLAMIVGIPVMQLVLFGYAINFTLRNLDTAIADQAGLTMIQLALGFVTAHPAVTTALIGPRTLDHLHAQLAAADTVLPAEGC